MKLYVASSWRNTRQPFVVEALRAAGHEVYDFRHPGPDNHGFSWREIAPDWESWTPEQFREALQHPTAQRGFGLDFGAMRWADGGVLVGPCGRSAHLEAGYFVGAGKPLHILLSPGEPELMYLMATRLHLELGELVEALKARQPIGLVRRLRDGLRAWARDEDGVHEDAWDAYADACVELGEPRPCFECGKHPCASHCPVTTCAENGS